MAGVKIPKLILLFCAIIPTIYTQCTVDRSKAFFKRPIYEFSLDLLTRLAQDTENHFVSSPLSAWSILACASLGASDETLIEMKQVLKLHWQKCFNNKYLEIVRSVTSSSETDVFVERSSVIFANEATPLTNAFINKIEETKICNIENIQFDNLEAAANRINEYVTQATHETLDDIVTPGDLEDILVVMIDALFFKGTWTKTFSDTEKSAFYNYKGNQIGDVNLMFSNGEYNITTIPQIEAKVLELPYGVNKRFSMLMFLPLKDVTVARVIDNLRLISLATIRYKFLEHGPENTMVQIPRFKISSDLSNLKELLIDMGLKTVFDSSQASFTNMSNYPLYITNVIQKADVEVTEEGTVASAASAVEFTSRSLPADFNANKPFLFMIVDNHNDVPIFIGAYSKPTLF